jgi:hypothetical protein
MKPEVNNSRIYSIIWIERLYLITVNDKTTAMLHKKRSGTRWFCDAMALELSKAFFMTIINYS